MRLLRQYLTRYKGVHRTVLSGKTRLAALLAVCALAIGGGAVAVGAASAHPGPPPGHDADVFGYVTICGPGADPHTVNYRGSAGDIGSVSVARNDWSTIHLRHVPPWGERISGTVDCFYRTHPMVLRKPFPAFVVWRSERHDIR